MRRSFGQLTQDALTITGNSGSGNKTFLQDQINDAERTVLSMRPWQFLEATQTVTTTDDGETYQLRPDTGHVLSVRESSNNEYPLHPVSDPDEWERIQSYASSASDTPTHYRVRGTVLDIYPAYDTAGNSLTVRYTKRRRDMYGDDYTTGTITSIANGAKAVIGNGTTWSQANGVISGAWMVFTGNTGDGLWYEISSVTDTTHLQLLKNYAGTSIAAATDSYRIGQMSLLPAGYEPLLMFRALATYFDQHENPAIATRYWRRYDGGMEIGERDTPGGLLGRLVDEFGDFDDSPYSPPADMRYMRDVNDPPTNITGLT